MSKIVSELGFLYCRSSFGVKTDLKMKGKGAVLMRNFLPTNLLKEQSPDILHP